MLAASPDANSVTLPICQSSPALPHQLCRGKPRGQTAGLTLEKFQKNQPTYVQGELAGTFGYIRMGRVKATVLSDHGKEAIVGIFQKDQSFGEACLGSAKLHTATIVALEECLITSITKETMLSTRNDSRSLAGRLRYRHGFLRAQDFDRHALLILSIADAL